jgi:menaquinone-dependent protoporphyrinogen IX oxidase
VLQSKSLTNGVATQDDSTDERGALDAELWSEVRDDVEALFGGDVDITVYEYADHLDVRVLPNGAVKEIEAKHDVKLVPYTACKLTIRKDD